MTAVATAPQSVLTSSEKPLHDFRPYGAKMGKAATATIKSKMLLSGGAELADAKETFGFAPQLTSFTASKFDRSQKVKPSVFSAAAAPAMSAAEHRADEVLQSLLPTQQTKSRRQRAMEYISKLVSNALKCEKVCAYGSVPLRTYLPDGDIDITALVMEEQPEWLQQLSTYLLSEEVQADGELEVRDVQAINAEVRLVKCVVDDLVVDISVNSVGGLCTLCFLEEVDRGIGNNHLYKRALLMVKAWCFYEGRLLGAHHGLMSTYAVETLLLFVFCRFGSALKTPLEVLGKFLEVFSTFDWENETVRLTHMSSTKASASAFSSLLPNAISSCMEQYSAFGEEITGKYSMERTFQQKNFNVADPLQPTNNVGRSVSKANLFRIKRALAWGAEAVKAALNEPKKELAIAAVDKIFKNTLRRYGSMPVDLSSLVFDFGSGSCSGAGATGEETAVGKKKDSLSVPVAAGEGNVDVVTRAWNNRRIFGPDCSSNSRSSCNLINTSNDIRNNTSSTAKSTFARTALSQDFPCLATSPTSSPHEMNRSFAPPPKLTLPEPAIKLDVKSVLTSGNNENNSKDTGGSSIFPSVDDSPSTSPRSNGSLSPSFFVGDELLSISDKFNLPTIRPPRVQEPLLNKGSNATKSLQQILDDGSDGCVANFGVGSHVRNRVGSLVAGCPISVLSSSTAKVEFTGLCTKGGVDTLSGDLPSFTTNLMLGIKAWQKVGPPTYPSNTRSKPGHSSNGNNQNSSHVHNERRHYVRKQHANNNCRERGSFRHGNSGGSYSIDLGDLIKTAGGQQREGRSKKNKCQRSSSNNSINYSTNGLSDGLHKHCSTNSKSSDLCMNTISHTHYPTQQHGSPKRSGPGSQSGDEGYSSSGANSDTTKGDLKVDDFPPLGC